MSFPHDGNKFVAGQTGNPNGRPSVRKLTAALVDKLEENDGEGYRTIMQKLYDLAKKGNLKAIQTVLERVDGKVTEVIDLTTKTFILKDELDEPTDTD